jgi:hypothetical protein
VYFASNFVILFVWAFQNNMTLKTGKGGGYFFTDTVLLNFGWVSDQIKMIFCLLAIFLPRVFQMKSNFSKGIGPFSQKCQFSFEWPQDQKIN